MDCGGFGNVEKWGKISWKDLGELETTEESCGLPEEKLDLERIRGELEKGSFGRNLLEAESRVLCIR